MIGNLVISVNLIDFVINVWLVDLDSVVVTSKGVVRGIGRRRMAHSQLC